MCGLAINIASFAHLLKKVDFDAVVDHLALTHIMRSKVESVTTRIKRLLEVLSSYSFNLYYIKGKDMIISDFLSRQKIDDRNPCEIIPISFNVRDVLREKYYNISNMEIDDKHLVKTRSQAKSSGVKLPEVHGIENSLNPHIKPGRQKPAKVTDTRVPISKPRIGQGRAGVRRRVRITLPIQTSAPAIKSLSETVTQSQVTVTMEHTSSYQTDMRQPIGPRIETRQVPFYPSLIVRLPPRPPDLKENRRDLSSGLDTEINVDFEENSPYQEGIISETYERLDKSYIKEPPELKDLINTTKLVQKFLPKQRDIDKILDVIHRKVLKGTHLPITTKEIQAGYLTSPYFKDLYLYLAQNKLLSKRGATHKVETLVERFILLDSLLFKLVTMPDRETVLLAVPEICVDKIITLYHTSFFAGHQGVPLVTNVLYQVL